MLTPPTVISQNGMTFVITGVFLSLRPRIGSWAFRSLSRIDASRVRAQWVHRTLQALQRYRCCQNLQGMRLQRSFVVTERHHQPRMGRCLSRYGRRNLCLTMVLSQVTTLSISFWKLWTRPSLTRKTQPRSLPSLFTAELVWAALLRLLWLLWLKRECPTWMLSMWWRRTGIDDSLPFLWIDLKRSTRSNWWTCLHIVERASAWSCNCCFLFCFVYWIQHKE